MRHESATEVSAAFLQDFLKGLSIVRGLNVTNNAAERDVALVKSLNSSVTPDEEQKKFLLQIFEEHRRRTNKNWYKILRTCNEQSDMKGEND